MSALNRPSLVDATCLYLRRSAEEGRWPEGKPPPVRVLAKSLEVAPNTVMAALRKLDAEGFFTGQGRARRIASTASGGGRRKTLRIGVFFRIPLEKESPTNRHFFERFVAGADHLDVTVVYAKKSSETCGGSPEKIRGALKAEGVDGWMAFCLVEADIRLLVETGLPVFCFAGDLKRFSLPGTGLTTARALVEATRHLLAIGHRRIVFVAPPHWISPQPLGNARNFLAELAAAGVKTGPFNLPAWDETPQGTLRLFEELFRFTPPTAMIFVDYPPLIALQGFLASRGISIPRDVSVVSLDTDPTLPWFCPAPAHCRYEAEALDKVALRWVKSLLRGEAAPASKLIEAEFVNAGSIAPPSVKN